MRNFSSLEVNPAILLISPWGKRAGLFFLAVLNSEFPSSVKKMKIKFLELIYDPRKFGQVICAPKLITAGNNMPISPF